MECLLWAFVIFVVIGIFSGDSEKKKQQAAQQEALRRRKEAEDYIMNSGDPEAIKTLMLARANPANYSQVLAGGMSKGNDILKTALGVMTGVVVGNLVANAISASAILSALDNMQADLNAADYSSTDEASFQESDSSSWDSGGDSSIET